MESLNICEYKEKTVICDQRNKQKTKDVYNLHCT